MNRVAEEIGGNRFEDISSDLPNIQEWNRAQQVEEEVQPTRFRARHKRPPGALEPTAAVPGDLDLPDYNWDLENESRERSRSRPPAGGPRSSQESGVAWWSRIPDGAWPDQQASYWNEPGAAIEIEIEMPDTVRGPQRAWDDLGSYFVGSLKRRAIELSEKKMTAEEREAFAGAKAIEVKNFVSSEAFEILPDHLKPDKSQAIGMRWILTWKLREDGTRKAKARAVLLGYQDEGYEHRATTSPVMTRQTRQLILQLAAWKRWEVQKSDVTGAFLQSREYPDKLYCVPCPEICRAMNIPESSITRVRKACYGLVDAPLEWYRSVDTFLQGEGFEKLWSDSCCWILRKDGEIKGAISGHVDDFLFGGKQATVSRRISFGLFVRSSSGGTGLPRSSLSVESLLNKLLKDLNFLNLATSTTCTK